ncbi:MAG TPA: DUF72 domain-containing protein [Chryseosolibacter sp.]
MTKGKFYIGTSGWHYRHWVGTFYPKDLKQDQQFEYYKKHFDTVEINNSFYRLPSPETFERWRKESGKTFLFVVKASRFITHNKKLKDPETSYERFFTNVKMLKQKLGPILFQLPPKWNVNIDRLRDFLRALPRKFRYVFEFRNETWYTEEVYGLLREYNCAFCIYELAGHTSPTLVTADYVYVRLHGPGDKYQGSYDNKQLKEWAKACRMWQHEGLDVFVYFDNDQLGYAAFNAKTLKEMVGIEEPTSGTQKPKPRALKTIIERSKGG